MKILQVLKLLLISVLFITVLSNCSLTGSRFLPAQTINQELTSTALATTLQVNPDQTLTVLSGSTVPAPAAIASPPAAPFPANTPVWSVYSYTCEFTADGGEMTMELTWIDRSDSEEGYNVYRNKQVIATLTPNSTYYVDVAFVAAGKALSYSVEAFNKDWRVSSSTITHGCQ
ncbi:MAG: hypothetical protein JXA13_03270 [Anaerolineales bacterium]|nr:hypothetical protein [Anaerolineales bacterium]